MKLWIVGKIDAENPKQWEFQGIYEDEEVAAGVCKGGTWFIGPANLNEPIPKDSITWPGAYYPTINYTHFKLRHYLKVVDKG